MEVIKILVALSGIRDKTNTKIQPMQTKLQDNSDILDNIQHGDYSVLSKMTITKGWNSGRGFSPSYIQKVLNPNYTQLNDEIVELARTYIQKRAELVS